MLALVVAIALAVYFLSVRPRLPPDGASQVELIAIGILLLALAVVVLIFLAALITTLLVAARTHARERVRPRLLLMRDAMIFILVCMLIFADEDSLLFVSNLGQGILQTTARCNNFSTEAQLGDDVVYGETGDLV